MTRLENFSTSETTRCKACGSLQVTILCEIDNAPVHSVMLASTRQEAIDFPLGRIRLGFCETCGFIFNTAFEPGLQDYYSDKYESTQAYSATFNTFQQGLAERLVARYDLHGKSIIEIGCGQGEFLALLCDIGGNRGTGFDPAYIEGDLNAGDNGSLTFIKDYYSEKYAHYQADFICCKMTLEHIHDPQDFIRMLRRSIGDRLSTVVFFQVPDVTRILRDTAFWDVYYEHCSYFSPSSLSSLFHRNGFRVSEVSVDYDDQYLMLDAVPVRESAGLESDPDLELAGLKERALFFRHNLLDRLQAWRRKIAGLKGEGARIVIWGAGSKCVAFLTSLGLTGEIEYAVDINPRKRGTFLAGSGKEIVGPQFLKEYQPDAVLVMNPIYMDEIAGLLRKLDVEAVLLPVE
jgi:SAM-dependent methyltransferase